MRAEPRDLSNDSTAAIAVCLAIFVLVAGLGCLGGYRLMQPRIIPNLGLAAYQPPPGTRLVPLPRKTDAPELADLPPTPVETVGAGPDRASPSVEKATVAASPKPVARRKPRPRPADDPASAYAYGGRWGYGDRGGGSWSSWRGGWNGRW